MLNMKLPYFHIVTCIFKIVGDFQYTIKEIFKWINRRRNNLSIILQKPIIKIRRCGGEEGGCSAERERKWNFPQQSRGVPRRGEPAVTNLAPPRARDKQTGQGFHLSNSALLPQTLGLYRQAGGFCEGLSIVAPTKVKSSCAFIVTGVYGDHTLSTCREIKRAN